MRFTTFIVYEYYKLWGPTWSNLISCNVEVSWSGPNYVIFSLIVGLLQPLHNSMKIVGESTKFVALHHVHVFVLLQL